MEGTSS